MSLHERIKNAWVFNTMLFLCHTILFLAFIFYSEVKLVLNIGREIIQYLFFFLYIFLDDVLLC